MELENLTDKEIQDRIDALSKPCEDLHLKLRPYRLELNRRKAESLLATKYFLDATVPHDRYIKVLSAKPGEFGVRDVYVDSVSFNKTSSSVYVARSIEELNSSWTCTTPITREVYEGALERAIDMLKGMTL